jgi:hypothetical protein
MVMFRRVDLWLRFCVPLSYRYQWLYDSISRAAALAVGGERRFRHLALQDLTLTAETKFWICAVAAAKQPNFW